MGGSAPPIRRNLAAPETAETQRQRSILATLIAAVDPDRAEDLAACLLGEFHSLARIWSQNVEAIERITGRGSRVAPLLVAVRVATEEATRAKLSRGAIRPEQTSLLDYLKASMGSLADENLRVLFLSGSRSLLADEMMQRGTIGQLAVYPRVLFRRAIELDAAAMILVHNHPSGDPTPSPNDEAVTDRLVELGRSLGVDIDEHIVVAAAAHRFILAGRNRRMRRDHRPFELRSSGPPREPDNDESRQGAATGTADDPARGAAALANARRTARRRLLRRQLLGADHLFGEPAWDMLIELFIHQAEGRPISTSSLGIASGLSASSGLRFVQSLEDAGLVIRESDPHDGRRSLIRLSPDTHHRLTVYFGAQNE